ncbi:ribonuclease D [Brunnivagina elsteri]|uniref:Ribonuclease D n=1 Tax=Brunnivagina elsteri CCALA 953 TaxID=987040 RepID=A0A2A2TB25_9CYAN|nr:ribonuclease D [Calothrix elsteri]PAX49074.1 ribonuclease D [Calothrix elsteri CCALA 953]
MPYLSSASEINQFITECTQTSILWLDTEVADFTTKKPRLSLIQVLDNPNDMSGERSFILDVLEQPDVVAHFINEIMINPAIEKVFHNASYDLRFLGVKKTKNVTCTLDMARKIPYHLLPLPNLKLQTLATEICNFQNINKQEQTSDWGQRPLTLEQIKYAYFDCIYLAQIHQKLVELSKKVNCEPSCENIILLSARYKEIEQQYKLLHSEIEHLEERLKKAMLAQNILETADFKLTPYERNTIKVAFAELAELVRIQELNLDFPVTLTKNLQKDLGDNLKKLNIEEEKTTSFRLNVRSSDNDE